MDRRVWASLAFTIAIAAVAAMLLGGLLSPARASEPASMLPNLVADPPDEAQLTTSSIEGRSRLLLRFTGYLHNDGTGALDVRGSRPEPAVGGKSPTELRDQIEFARVEEQSLPQTLEEELATPAMKAQQRIFQVPEIRGRPTESLEREHIDQPINAQIVYSNADGHHHWHLQRIARYSLWDASRSAEVAPAQKVGFCLTDSQHVEPQKGPATPVYSNNAPPYESFCRRFEPNATSIYEGISPGWRDRYGNELAFQWVDASDVAPGEYWLREDVDPGLGLEEAGGGSKYEYATKPTIIPGVVAEPQTIVDREGEPIEIELGVHRYQDESQPVETIISPPTHGTVSRIEGGRLTYTPAPGYAGEDSFSFAASDANSQFPESPPVAEVSISVASQAPTISIGGAQGMLIASTSEELSAAVSNDSGAVEWEASAGTITPSGESGRDARFTAPSVPPPGGALTVTARLRDHPSSSASVSIVVSPPPPPTPQPEPPPVESGSEPPRSVSGSEPPPSVSGSEAALTGAGPVGTGAAPTNHGTPPVPRASTWVLARTGGVEAPQGGSTQAVTEPALSAPRAMLMERELVITTTPRSAGRITISATAGGRALGRCSALTTAGRAFSCRITLRRGVSARTPIAILVELHSGTHRWRVSVPPHELPKMVMRPVGNHARVAGGGLWCTPATLVGVLIQQPAN